MKKTELLRGIRQLMLATLLLLSASVTAMAAGPADTPVSINFKSEQVTTVLKEVQRQSGLNFFYSAELAKEWPRITIRMTKKPAEEVVAKIASLIGCEYTMKSNIVTISKQKLSGRERIIKGHVRDSDGELLVGVPICIGESRVCTVTDADGYYTFKILEVAGCKDVILSTTGYTGAGGCEVYMKNEDAIKVFDAIFEAGKEFNIVPAGLGCRDTLRLEMGFCLYGNDIDDDHSPLEANLGWITKFNDVKGDFVDRDYMLKQKAEGLKRRLCGFELIDRGVPRHGYEICNAEGRVIGNVTSGSLTPCCARPIGMGYVEAPLYKLDTEIYIKVRDRLLKAVVVRPPFYKG